MYHGTHALFVDRHAVFVVLWEPEREEGEHVENGIAMRHHPLSYWLDYIRGLAGTEAPVVVVRNKCDGIDADVSAHPHMPGDFGFSEHVAFSAAEPEYLLPGLRHAIRRAVAALLKARGFDQIGVGRVKVRDHLRALLERDQQRPKEKRKHRTLTVEQFRAICRDVAPGEVSDPAALLDFLHHTGVVYHHAGQFESRIVLDQEWALDAIYTIFHRQATLRQLRDQGGDSPAACSPPTPGRARPSTTKRRSWA